MARKSARARPPQKTPLTLADVHLVREVGRDRERVSGDDLARLLIAAGGEPNRKELVSAVAVGNDLLVLADIVGALGIADHAGYDIDGAIVSVAAQLRRLGYRALASTPSIEAGGYRVVSAARARRR